MNPNLHTKMKFDFIFLLHFFPPNFIIFFELKPNCKLNINNNHHLNNHLVHFRYPK